MAESRKIRAPQVHHSGSPSPKQRTTAPRKAQGTSPGRIDQGQETRHAPRQRQGEPIRSQGAASDPFRLAFRRVEPLWTRANFTYSIGRVDVNRAAVSGPTSANKPSTSTRLRSQTWTRAMCSSPARLCGFARSQDRRACSRTSNALISRRTSASASAACLFGITNSLTITDPANPPRYEADDVVERLPRRPLCPACEAPYLPGCGPHCLPLKEFRGQQAWRTDHSRRNSSRQFVCPGIS
jgi:hypothetical protein